jgi:hypothetical protein
LVRLFRQTLTLAGICWPFTASGLPLRRFTTESGHADRIGQVIDNTLLRNDMNTQLTEEEMRRALFGDSESLAPAITSHVQDSVPDVVIVQPVKAAKKKIVSKGFTPRLKVTLRVGNEFEGEMHEMVHEADTLSSLVAEQEATKAARTKFRFVEVVSVKSM